MDQVMSTRARDEQVEQIVTACQGGLILVDSSGRVLWMDEAVRRRVNGELQSLALPLSRSENSGVDCFISPVDLTVNGKRQVMCVIQEVDEHRDSRDLIATLEAIMADSTSWLTRTVIEKLKALRHVRQPAAASAASSSDLDLLSDREREVLGLICEGRSDVQMSDMLGLSENTVRNHIASLYRKIGVNRRTAAIIWARERGITARDALNVKRRRHLPSDRAGKSVSY